MLWFLVLAYLLYNYTAFSGSYIISLTIIVMNVVYKSHKKVSQAVSKNNTENSYSHFCGAQDIH